MLFQQTKNSHTRAERRVVDVLLYLAPATVGAGNRPNGFDQSPVSAGIVGKINIQDIVTLAALWKSPI